MKYIIFENISTKLRQREVIMFPDAIIHSTVMIKPYREDHYVWRSISAGSFVANSRLDIETFGDSESLKLKPHPEDERIIEDRLMGGTTVFMGDRE